MKSFLETVMIALLAGRRMVEKVSIKKMSKRNIFMTFVIFIILVEAKLKKMNII